VEAKKVSPVKVGDIVQVECINEGRQDGTGVCKYQGFILFVEGAVKGNTYEVEIIQVAERYGKAKLL